MQAKPEHAKSFLPFEVINQKHLTGLYKNCLSSKRIWNCFFNFTQEVGIRSKNLNQEGSII